MKFKITTAGWTYNEKSDKYINELKKLGFKFNENNGRVTLSETITLEINSIKDLIKLSKKLKKSIILNTVGDLLIYDDYIE